MHLEFLTRSTFYLNQLGVICITSNALEHMRQPYVEHNIELFEKKVGK